MAVPSKKAEYASDILRSSYDLNSIGIGVQRQLVDYLVRNPDEVAKRNYLAKALDSGTDSNFIAEAGNHGKDVFEEMPSTLILARISSLGEEWQRLEYKLWRTLAYGSSFEQSEDSLLEMNELNHLFGELAKRGYFSGVPSDDAMRAFLSSGCSARFYFALGKSGISPDFDKIPADRQGLMLGDGKGQYAKFHAGKLNTMADIADEALSVLRSETQASDYRLDDAKRQDRWMELFGEELPSITELVSSARQTTRDVSVII